MGEGLLVPQDIGQMQLYKHYYEREMMNPGDNPPIGIVLGSDRDEAVIRYPDFPRSNEKPQDFLGFCLKVFTTLSFLCCGWTLRYLGWWLVGKS